MKSNTLLLFVLFIHLNKSYSQSGPDPWNYDGTDISSKVNNIDVPPDLRIPLRKKVQSDVKPGLGEWFFKRTLAIILKGGQTKIDDDGNVDVSIQMRINPKHWEILEDCLKSNTPLSEDMFRRAVGYVENSICKPTIVETVAVAWSEFIKLYLIEYKLYITWSLAASGAVVGLLCLWKQMSHKHVIILVFILLYFYEVFISYKEAEQQELHNFLSAVSTCKWYFWSSSCEIPPPDPLIFMKHMNPIKIGIRMLTTILAEPMLTMSDIIKTMTHGLTDWLWFPFDKIAHTLLIVTFNIILIILFILIIYNYILNIPFKFSFFGLMSFGMPQRNRRITTFDTVSEQPNTNLNRIEGDRISEATLDKILNVCSLAMSNNVKKHVGTSGTLPIEAPKIKRSASTGRLPNVSDYNEFSNDICRKRSKGILNTRHNDGSGDAH